MASCLARLLRVSALGAEPLRLGSGAGHDGRAMAKLCATGMLFVRCRGGISHNPMEYASPRDLGLAVAALIGFIERFEPGLGGESDVVVKRRCQLHAGALR